MTERNEICLMAGAAKVDITPPVGTCLFGYQPGWESTSVHDNLSATALALSQGNVKVILITAENCEVKTELCTQIRQKIEECTGISWKNVIISCTHTHSAPNVRGAVGWGDVDMEYYQNQFLPGLVEAAKQACSAMYPAEIAVGETESKVGINRRQQKENNDVCLGQNPYGCFDPYMTVIAVRNAETKEGILNLIHYGCHGTGAGKNREITRDWSGVMIDRMEKETGTITAFWNGAIGDVGPRLTNGLTTGCGDITYALELGAVAAADAIKTYALRGGYHTAKLEVFNDEMKLPYQKMPELAEVEEELAKYGDTSDLVNINRATYEYYVGVKKFLTEGKEKQPEALYLDQTIVALGDVLFIPFPFEHFSEISMRLRAYSNYRYTLTLSNTSGNHMYLPTRDQLCRGGYEVNTFNYSYIFRLAEDTDQNIITENLRILRGGKE